MHADLQRLMADEILADLRSKPLPRLRGLRMELSQAEGDVSFVRRVAQGRLDIAGHEVARREAADPDGDGAPRMATASGLLFDMPDILTDPDRRPGFGRDGSLSEDGTDDVTLPRRNVDVLEPGPVALELFELLDKAASPHALSGVEALPSADLADLFDRLRQFELELSAMRRALHDRIDVIQDEIARRYRDGETSVEALLNES